MAERDRSGPQSTGTEKMWRTTLWSLLRQRCPRCCLGDLFRTMFTMNETCPVCGLRFEREEGYFLGALYVSYPISALLLGLGILAAYLLFPDLRLEWDLLIAAIAYLPFMPVVFRYSRAIWIYFDRWASPHEL